MEEYDIRPKNCVDFHILLTWFIDSELLKNCVDRLWFVSACVCVRRARQSGNQNRNSATTKLWCICCMNIGQTFHIWHFIIQNLLLSLFDCWCVSKDWMAFEWERCQILFNRISIGCCMHVEQFIVNHRLCKSNPKPNHNESNLFQVVDRFVEIQIVWKIDFTESA